MTTFFSHHRLPVLQCHPSLFCPKKLTTFFAHHRRFIDISLGRHPTEGVTPHLFYLSDLICPLFSINLPTKILFPSGVTPWRVSPGAVRLLVTPLF